MSREDVIMLVFAILSVFLLIAAGIRERKDLRLFYALAVSGDLYSAYANTLGVGLGYWSNPVRVLPDIFDTSLVYDLLFFPAVLVGYLVWMPRRIWARVAYTLFVVGVICLLEKWLVSTTDLIAYHKGWTIWKTASLYLMTYVLFCGLFRWLAGHWPGSEKKKKPAL
jgi:hypothetical protein